MSAQLEQALSAVQTLATDELLAVQDAITQRLRHKIGVSPMPATHQPALLDWDTASAEEIIADMRAGRDDRIREFEL